MLYERKVVLDHLHRVRTALGELAYIRPKLQGGVIDCVQGGVGLVAGFDAGAGVLVEDGRNSLIGNGLGGFVERRYDVCLVLGEVVGVAGNRVRPQNKDAAAVFLDQLCPVDGFVDGLLPLVASVRLSVQ